MRKVGIIGIGHGKFGVRTDVNINELAWEAIKLAYKEFEKLVKPKVLDFVLHL